MDSVKHNHGDAQRRETEKDTFLSGHGSVFLDLFIAFTGESDRRFRFGKRGVEIVLEVVRETASRGITFAGGSAGRR
jgi:hypothetical protein